MYKKAVILLSGGLDSSTVLAMVNKENYEIHGLSFNYCQNNVIEVEKIKKFVRDYNIHSHKIIDLDLSVFRISSLVNQELDVPKYSNAKEVGSSIPNTYVPARNTIFLSYALGYAETVGASNIFIGAHASDSANYPDCRPEYIKSFENMANLATKQGIEGHKIKICAPLLRMSKSDIVKEGLALSVNYANTISCYDPSAEGEACGGCLACNIRLEAFKDNAVSDPAEYINNLQ
ncbi:MAG TPA: 7-cyano-7-deazaguanine synthase QueC [Candidatus Megaira endosymbiont of Nemacystus decipiens]|nr:7-cyano-7-deazaguanine synthase QueC [Candidatus Megaera endosymbiont of Nemacystus decipiens]